MMIDYYYHIKDATNRQNLNLQFVEDGIKYGVELSNPDCKAKVYPHFWVLSCKEPMTNRELRKICKSVVYTAQLGRFVKAYYYNEDPKTKTKQRSGQLFKCFGGTVL